MDKIRLHFWHNDDFYEKWIEIDYSGLDEDLTSYRLKFGHEKLSAWYREVSGKELSSPVPAREIKYSQGTPEECLAILDGRN